MTIYLPEEVDLFRQAFDAACDRISKSEKDTIFYSLLVELASRLQEHSFFKDFLIGLESASAKRKEEFETAALEALEDQWARLWKYHHRSPKHRKELVRIKRIVTAPCEYSCSSLYDRILFQMWEFRYFSPFCRFLNEAPRLFRAMQSELNLASLRFDYAYPSKEGYFSARKVSPCKLKKTDRLQGLHKKIFDPGANGARIFNRSAECVPLALFSPKTEEIEKKFIIPGRNEYEKRRNMQIMAETDPAFCWEKIRFLLQCFSAIESYPVLKPIKGEWFAIRENAWKTAQERCNTEVLLGAKMALEQKLSPEPSSSIDSFVAIEHQMHRKDYEKYLQSLKNHVHARLFKVASLQQKLKSSPLQDLPGTQKEDFVIDLTKRFWKEHPLDNRDAAYEYYRLNCPSRKLLKRDRWEQIIRKRELDPRPPEAKKRGPGKKTCKK